ncbi:MAG: hypothetical protein A4E40_00794 [Methanoregulaceae archaeon PtaU1.Bin059]|nr:MAG: hypothetical protein A4E40_00794 [Methanoregulaceae archaeon PtaU1.Bin059]
MKKYMSLKATVPDLIISRHASFVPQYTSSPVRWASRGQIFWVSQSCSGMSSAKPRSRVMAAWVWVFTRPGSARSPAPSMLVSASPRKVRAMPSPTDAMVPVSSTNMSWSVSFTTTRSIRSEVPFVCVFFMM